jgi:hypothetical protein
MNVTFDSQIAQYKLRGRGCGETICRA